MMRKRYRLKEDLNVAATEPAGSPAAQEAAKLGLQYVGFGRYEDPRTGQVTHIVQNDQLVPYNKAVGTNTYQQQSSNDINNFAQEMSQSEQELHQALLQEYGAAGFKNDELDAIREFTSGAYKDINERLSELPAGIPAEEIQPESAGDPFPSMIQSLDNALAKNQTQASFVVYNTLDGNAFDITQFKSNTIFAFKGYGSTSISLANALQYNSSYAEGGKNIVVIQIKVPAGSNGAYVDDYSANPGENEFVLPRGSKVKIVSGPNKLIGAVEGNRKNIFYFNAELVNE
jgi:hypothetical protein